MEEKNRHLERFIRSTLTFKTGERLELLDFGESAGNQMALAASGNSVSQTGFHRVGMLANDRQSVLARIFHSKSHQEYRLYFLNEEGSSITGSIITGVNTFKYFFVDEEQYAIIPETAEINPLKDSLLLVTPEAQVTIDNTEWNGGTEKQLSGKQEYLVQMRLKAIETENATSAKHIVYCTITAENDEDGPSKMLYRQGKVFRLVPVQNRTATVRLHQLTREPIKLYFYR